MKKQSLVRMSKIVPHPNRSFTLMPYTPKWKSQFETKAATLRQLLGSEALAIEHVGSTSVPGMLAKPQIDILVVVRDLNKIRSYYQKMRQAGFTPRGDYTGEGEEYFTEDTKDGKRKVSIHILPEGHVWAADFINYRDYLRAHPKEIARYSEIKRKAADQNKNDYNAYYKSKLEVIQELRQKAAEWKAAKALRQKYSKLLK